MTMVKDMSKNAKHIANGLFVEEAAWHGEGTVISLESAKALGATGLFRDAGLDWNVELRDLKITHENADMLSGLMGITRTDTGKVFGAASEDYKLFQNSEVAQHVQSYLDTGLFNPSAFVSLKDGAWNAATLKVGDSTLSNGDQMRRMAVWTWGHDGKQGVRLMLGNVRVVCCNTFRLAIKDAKSIRHKGAIQEKMDKIRSEHFTMLGHFAKNDNFFNRLLELPMKSSWVEQYAIAKHFDVERVMNAMNLEKKDEGTMFQGYQAVSRWSDHDAGGKKVQSRMRHVLVGTGATRMQKVTAEFMELMSKPFIRNESEPEFRAWLDDKLKNKDEETEEVT